MPKHARIVVSAANSGAGKTSVSIALLHSLKKRGISPQPFKAGPDFLDPFLLSKATGRDCRNLDTWMMEKEYLLSLVEKASVGSGIAVIEGVMGLFDGAALPRSIEEISPPGSTAELAKLLEAPVILVVDATGMAQSVAAMVKGFCELDKGIKIAGVIANRIGSERHREILSNALKSHGLPPLVGGIPKGAFPELPRRHLGLIKQETLSEEFLEKFSDTLEKHCSVDSIISLAGFTGLKEGQAGNGTPKPARNERVKIGIAMDEAFNFYYKDLLDLIEEEGGALVPFSPVNDKKLPQRLDAIWFGGGYPEEYAKKLSENREMLEEVRGFAAKGGMIYAECGGLIYLSEGIELLDGSKHPFAGIIPSWCRMNGKFKKLGYSEVALAEDTAVGPCGTRLRGHSFHYSEMTGQPEGWRNAYETSENGQKEKGFAKGNILASYIHLHFHNNVKNFVKGCKGER